MNSSKYALIIATGKWPARIHGQDSAFHTFLSNVNTPQAPRRGVVSLAENVWQIDLSDGLQALSEILHHATDWKVQIRVLFLDSEPNWANYPVPGKPVTG